MNGPKHRVAAISDGFSQAELGKFYGLSKMQIARRMAALRHAIEEQLSEQ